LKKKVILSFGLVLGVLLLLNFAALRRPQPAASDESLETRPENCTVIMVGRDASTDGSTMTTHTCDCGTCDWTFRTVPAADHKRGETRKIYHINQYKTWPPSQGLKWDIIKNDSTGLELPEPPHTYGYIHGMFGYLNDQQLAIGESSIGCQKKMENPTPTVKFDISMLTLLAMERCRTAREAVKLMGSLAEKYGYGYNDSGEMLAVADPQEVWVFEIMPVGPLWTPKTGKPGAVWCAERVPDDQVAVCPNESRIGEIDLKNPDFFMASPNVVSLAVEMGFYDPKYGKPFNWKRAYDPVEGSLATSGRRARIWRFHDLVAPSQKFSPELANMDYPFSVKPDKKVSVQDVMDFTRDRCQGTAYDSVKGIRGGPYANPNLYRGTRTIGTNRAEYTTITQSRGWLPAPLGGLVWIAFGAQDTACYMPMYAGVSDVPQSFRIGDHFEFNRDSARWAFDYVNYIAQPAYLYALEDIKLARIQYEQAMVARIPEVDREAAGRFQKSPSEAAAYLSGWCWANADQVVKAWWELGDKLLVKYNHGGVYNVDKRTRDSGKPEISETWRKAVKTVDAWVDPVDK
jgi:dipeptidase